MMKKKKSTLPDKEYWDLSDRITALEVFYNALADDVTVLEDRIGSDTKRRRTPEPPEGTLVKVCDFSDRVAPTFYVCGKEVWTHRWTYVAGFEDDVPRSWEFITAGSYEVIYQP
jgi:hypothetical protein